MTRAARFRSANGLTPSEFPVAIVLELGQKTSGLTFYLQTGDCEKSMR
jgi:hypothetical protein